MSVYAQCHKKRAKPANSRKICTTDTIKDVSFLRHTGNTIPAYLNHCLTSAVDLRERWNLSWLTPWVFGLP